MTKLIGLHLRRGNFGEITLVERQFYMDFLACVVDKAMIDPCPGLSFQECLCSKQPW